MPSDFFGGEPLGPPHAQEIDTLPTSRPLIEENSTKHRKKNLGRSTGFLSKLIPAKEKKPKAIDEATMAFGMNMQKTMEILRQSKIYKDALSKNKDDLGNMIPMTLEGQLRQLIKEPAAQATIRTYKLTPAEAVAVRFYGREGFTNVQPALRGKPDPSLGGIPNAPADTFENLVDAIASCFVKLPPLPGKMTLFRGSPYFDYESAEEYQDPAFVSTSMDEGVVREKFPGGFLLKFKVSPSTACRDISTLTGNPSEAEVLFLPGTTFRILLREKEGDMNVITLEPA